MTTSSTIPLVGGMDPTIPWTPQQILECTQFGKLYLVAKKKPSGLALVYRLRRRKERHLYTEKPQWLNLRPELQEGELAFVDSGGYVCRLIPNTDLKCQIEKIL